MEGTCTKGNFPGTFFQVKATDMNVQMHMHTHLVTLLQKWELMEKTVKVVGFLKDGLLSQWKCLRSFREHQLNGESPRVILKNLLQESKRLCTFQIMGGNGTNLLEILNGLALLLTYGVPAGEAMKLYLCATLLATHI